MTEPIQKLRRLRQMQFSSLQLENSVVKKDERLARLFHTPERVFLRLRKMDEKSPNVIARQFARMPLPVKQHESPHLFGMPLARFGPSKMRECLLPHPIQKAWRSSRYRDPNLDFVSHRNATLSL